VEEEGVAEKVRYILESLEGGLTSFYRATVDSGSGGKRRQFSNEQVELLLQLESKIDTDRGKEFFWLLMGFSFIWPVPAGVAAALLSSLPRRKAWDSVKQHCDVAVMVYLKSGRVDEVLDGLLIRVDDYTSISEPNTAAISSLYQAVLTEPHLFSDDQLRKLEGIVDKYQHWMSKAISITVEEFKQAAPSLPPTDVVRNGTQLAGKLRSVLTTVRYERIKQELKGISSEINQDKRQLVRKYQELKLDSKLIEALERIDFEIEESGSGFDYSKSIAHVRNIYEESLRQFATGVRDKKKLAIPQWTERGKMGEAISYFRSIGLISRKEEQLLHGFSGFLSEAGSHRLASEKYEVRIAKNILVEICSYLVDKVDTFLRKQ
jgi:hypothetical protein